MINQREFDNTIKEFDELENRGSYYPMFLNMIEKGLDTEAFLFILSTWNFAVFRYAMKDFDLNEFKQTIKSLKPYFNKFANKNIKDIQLDNYENEIKYIFTILSTIKGVQFTGASKLMHLMVPEVFVMWDGYIRKAYEFKSGDSNDYFNFLKKMQEEFNGLKHKNFRTLAKCIDKYNYAKVTLPALERNRNKKTKTKL